MGRPVKELSITEEEREVLQTWARRPKSTQRVAQRARIVLGCADGAANKEVAEELGVSEATVSKWRERFRLSRLEGLADEPRPGAPRTITDDQVEAVITTTLESKPTDATHWSTRSMAAKVGLSQSALSRIWRAFGLQPHHTRHSSSPPIHSSCRRCATSWGCTWTRLGTQWCSAWTRRDSARPWNAPSRYCPCLQGTPSGARTTTSDTGPPRSSPPSTFAPGT
jgi:transposase